METKIAQLNEKVVITSWLTVICWLILAIPAFATETNTLTSYEKGVAFVKKGLWDEAISELTKEIVSNPTNTAALNYRSVGYYMRGHWKEAIADWTEVIRLEPTNALAYYSRAIAYRSSHQYEKAMADVNESLRLNETNGFAYEVRASLYSFNGEFEKAIADWNKGLPRNPKNARGITCRGSDYFQSGQFTNALRDHRAAIRVDPECDLAYNNLAWLLATCPVATLRDGKEAVRAATKACELSQWQRWDWLDTLAAAYAETGDFANAVKYQKKALTFDGINEKDLAQAKHKLSLYQNRQPNHDGQRE